MRGDEDHRRGTGGVLEKELRGARETIDKSFQEAGQWNGKETPLLSADFESGTFVGDSHAGKQEPYLNDEEKQKKNSLKKNITWGCWWGNLTAISKQLNTF